MNSATNNTEHDMSNAQTFRNTANAIADTDARFCEVDFDPMVSDTDADESDLVVLFKDGSMARWVNEARCWGLETSD